MTRKWFISRRRRRTQDFDAIRKANKEGKQPKMGAQALDHTSNVVVKIVEQIFGLDFSGDSRLSGYAADSLGYRARRSRRSSSRNRFVDVDPAGMG